MTTYAPIIPRPSEAAAALNGKIVLPVHGRYDAARVAWNLAVDQRPAAVVFADSAADVSAAVRFARRHGLRVAAQGTGHAAETLGDLSDTILVKTERMRRIEIDPEHRSARVEAGVVWLELVEAAARHGLAALAGSSPDVGVVGYTLGGGLSFLSRRYGLAANAVRSIELVTADGREARVDAHSDADLFWALRGGGGSFSVVTALEFELFPLAEAYAGILWYPIERAREVLHAWRELTESDRLPDELTTVGRLLNLPPIPEIPEPVRGKSFVIVEAFHVGESGQADELLAPLRGLGPVNDTVQPVPLPALSHLHMDPEEPVAGLGDGVTLRALPPAAVDALVDVAGADAAFPLLSVEVRRLGGEIGRSRPGNGALGSIDAAYVAYAVGALPAPELEVPVRNQVQAVNRALAPWAADHMYLNFADSPREPSSFWTEAAHRRLRRIKAAVDPQDIIRSNRPVRPAT